MTALDGIDVSARRIEDPPLIRGEGTYTDDLRVPHALHAHFVRAGWAHASITAIDTSEAARAPGVVAVLTAQDLDLPGMPADGIPDAMARPVLARDRVRFAGEAVAIVVAETRGQAVDAAELVFVDLEPLDVLVDPRRALEPTAPRLYPEGNLAGEGSIGSEGALDDAEVVVRAAFVNQRVAAVPMEPAAALAEPDPRTGGVVLHAPVQAQFFAREAVARVLRLAEEQVRVVSPAVGGGFGARIATYPEQVAIAALALRLDRPVRYVEPRSESMIAMQHGRAQHQEVELGARRDGTLTGLKVRVTADCGAYPADATDMPSLTGLMGAGVYRLPRIDFAWRCVVTNTTPIGAYRGAGRPEATALLERAMDMLAAELGIDPAELRRRNLIPPEDFPHETVTGASYDSGDYARALDRALELAGYAGLRAEQAERRRRGDVHQLGIGMSTYVEMTGWGNEAATCRIDEDGRATVTIGTSPQGQGHETTWTQILGETLGIAASDVTVVHSDTGRIGSGSGTMGSRSVQVGGSAIRGAADDVLEQAKRVAARELEADPRDIDVLPGSGLGVAGSPASALSWAHLARLNGGFSADHDFETADHTYPFGAHVAVVEVDTQTGLARLLRHVAVDDAGRIASPRLAEGQIHGGIAQGVAQALFEEIAFDEDGNCVTGSLASYAIISAADLPSFETERMETPTSRNPLGAKGIGESGTIGSTPAVWNAVVDALSHLGVRNVDMPATPQRVWEAIGRA
jgi:carbon-monoxide dehydrogenase large subunit